MAWGAAHPIASDTFASAAEWNELVSGSEERWQAAKDLAGYGSAKTVATVAADTFIDQSNHDSVRTQLLANDSNYSLATGGASRMDVSGDIAAVNVDQFVDKDDSGQLYDAINTMLWVANSSLTRGIEFDAYGPGRRRAQGVALNEATAELANTNAHANLGAWSDSSLPEDPGMDGTIQFDGALWDGFYTVSRWFYDWVSANSYSVAILGVRFRMQRIHQPGAFDYPTFDVTIKEGSTDPGLSGQDETYAAGADAVTWTVPSDADGIQSVWSGNWVGFVDGDLPVDGTTKHYFLCKTDEVKFTLTASERYKTRHKISDIGINPDFVYAA